MKKILMKLLSGKREWSKEDHGTLLGLQICRNEVRASLVDSETFEPVLVVTEPFEVHGGAHRDGNFVHRLSAAIGSVLSEVSSSNAFNPSLLRAIGLSGHRNVFLVQACYLRTAERPLFKASDLEKLTQIEEELGRPVDRNSLFFHLYKRELHHSDSIRELDLPVTFAMEFLCGERAIEPMGFSRLGFSEHERNTLDQGKVNLLPSSSTIDGALPLVKLPWKDTFELGEEAKKRLGVLEDQKVCVAVAAAAITAERVGLGLVGKSKLTASIGQAVSQVLVRTSDEPTGKRVFRMFNLFGEPMNMCYFDAHGILEPCVEAVRSFGIPGDVKEAVETELGKVQDPTSTIKGVLKQLEDGASADSLRDLLLNISRPVAAAAGHLMNAISKEADKSLAELMPRLEGAARACSDGKLEASVYFPGPVLWLGVNRAFGDSKMQSLSSAQLCRLRFYQVAWMFVRLLRYTDPDYKSRGEIHIGGSLACDFLMEKIASWSGVSIVQHSKCDNPGLRGAHVFASLAHRSRFLGFDESREGVIRFIDSLPRHEQPTVFEAEEGGEEDFKLWDERFSALLPKG